MAGDYYTKSGNPSTNAAGESSVIRNEFALIETGLNKLLQLTGNGSKFWRVNSGATAVEGVSATGSGSVVLATSPTLVTPILGTPTSGTLTNCTGLPVATGISGLASGIAAWLADPTSAKLATALTDENGSGKAIFAAGTLAITSGKTLTASNTLTLAGTDGSTLNVGAGGTLGSAALLAGAGTTYSPTVANVSNTSGLSSGGAFYIRLQNIVLVFVQIALTTTGSGSASFTITLPIASNLGSTADLIGTGEIAGTASASARVAGDAINDKAQVNWEPAAVEAMSGQVIFGYRII